MKPTVKKTKQKCPASGSIQCLSWFPDDRGYPGAVVCIECSMGVQVLKGSVTLDDKEFSWGTVKVHYPRKD